jgi:DNA-binding response OmpR family regulator
LLELICTRLDLAGYQSDIARDGLEALNQLRAVRPDAMILHINMPQLDGFAAIEKLRANPGLGRVPVRVLTARHASDDVRRAIALGAGDFMAMPFNDTQLLVRAGAWGCKHLFVWGGL